MSQTSVIVSKGHSRPLADISFVNDSDNEQTFRTLLVSACHGNIYTFTCFPYNFEGIH